MLKRPCQFAVDVLPGIRLSGRTVTIRPATAEDRYLCRCLLPSCRLLETTMRCLDMYFFRNPRHGYKQVQYTSLHVQVHRVGANLMDSVSCCHQGRWKYFIASLLSRYGQNHNTVFA